MANSDLDGRARGRPLLHILAAFPIACFTCALGTDIAYAQTADMMWDYFSTWLLAVGIGMGAIAALVALIGLAARRRGGPRIAWPVAVACALVLLLGLLNNFVHSRDAWTSVVPLGLTLSAVTVAVMLATAWFAFSGRGARPLTTMGARA